MLMRRQGKDTPEGARRRADAEPDTTGKPAGNEMRTDPKFGPGQNFKDDASGGNRYEGGLREGKRTGEGGGVPFVEETAGSMRGTGKPSTSQDAHTPGTRGWRTGDPEEDYHEPAGTMREVDGPSEGNRQRARGRSLREGEEDEQ